MYCLFVDLYEEIRDEQVDTVYYHKFLNILYKPVSAKFLVALEIKITDKGVNQERLQMERLCLNYTSSKNHNRI